METYQKHRNIILTTIILTLLSIRDNFFVYLLLYIWLIAFSLSDLISKKQRIIIEKVIWAILAIQMVLVFYINNYMPHGPMYPTGEYTCQNDNRGPCTKEYYEDMRKLNIPEWAKFMRKNDFGILFALLFVACLLYGKNNDD